MDGLKMTNLLTLPTTRDENWKYTDVSYLAQFPITTPTISDIDSSIIAAYVLAEHYLLFVNGFFKPELSKLPSEKNVVLIQQGHAQQGHVQRAPTDAFYLLNTAHLQHGAYITFSKNTLATPLQLLFINTEKSWIQPRNIITLEANSQATLIETHVSLNECVNNTITEICLMANAQLEYCKILREHEKTSHIGCTYVDQATHSKFTSHSLALTARLARSDIHVTLREPEATCYLNGLYVAQKREHIDHHTVIDHVATHCKSHEFYRGIINDKARAVFNGKVIVRPDAQKTHAEQHNHNLLLSSDAEIDTKPELEIYANDVQCAHGATIGQLDEDALFYLRARGIDETTAKQMLISAFAEEVIEKITLVALREKLHDLLREKLCLT